MIITRSQVYHLLRAALLIVFLFCAPALLFFSFLCYGKPYQRFNYILFIRTELEMQQIESM